MQPPSSGECTDGLYLSYITRRYLTPLNDHRLAFGHPRRQHPADRFIRQRRHFNDRAEAVVQRLIQLLRSKIPHIHRREESEVRIPAHHFAIIQPDKSVVIQQGIEERKVLGLREVDLLKDYCAALPDCPSS